MSLTIALAGNPNCGKTTLFNKLTGANQHVGNWPGVTIDRKEGKIKGTDAILVDTPGIYSLSPYSPEEVVTRNYLIESGPDAVINIVDATNLRRNLFLTLQILDTGLPTVVALNMMDAIEKDGDSIDVGKLSRSLGCPVVPMSALKGDGVDELVKKVLEVAASKNPSKPILFDEDIEKVVDKAKTALKGKVPDQSLRWHAVKVVEKDENVLSENAEAVKAVEADIAALEETYDDSSDAIVADARYSAISTIVDGAVDIKPKGDKGTLSDRVDRIVTHRILGLPIFIGIIGLLFFSIIGYEDITGIGTYFTDLLNDFIAESVQPAVSDWCSNNGVNDILSGLLVDGIIGGVGAVIGFLPQMLIMFLALCILEDVGYMARVAFVMDRVFRYFGLSGKSFIPVLVGVGCGVPGIMASRTIESEKDRRITAMTVTFMPCSAKLPVIAMIAGALFGGNGLVALFSYLLGILVILMSGIILKKWKSLVGKPAPFIMELPPYHRPVVFNILKGTADRGWAFVKRAGTLILLSAVLIWFLASFDTSLHFIENNTTNGSILESVGKVLAAVFVPLGWGFDNWELTVGTITGLMAKENIIATFGTLFGIEAGESGEGLEMVLQLMLTPAAGLGFLTFNLLCAPCFAAIGAMHRELGTWKSTAVAVAYQCTMAYLMAMIVYASFSLALGSDIEMYSLVGALIAFAVLAYFLISKHPFGRGQEAAE